MTAPATESVNPKSRLLDTREPEAILSILLEAQVAAVRVVEKAIPEIADAAGIVAGTVRSGGRIAYAAAGSSALMAMADGLELPGTFNIPNGQIAILLAGGTASLEDMTGGTEDDATQAGRDVAAAGLGPGDCIIGVSASGSTPYTVAALRAASKAGARSIAIANNPGAPLLEAADIEILLPTPPEIVSGSTRLGAASAHKVALNMMSTLMAVHLGHVHDGYMVNLRADNDKLRKRASRIVAEISGCNEDTSTQLLKAAGGSVKRAVLLAKGAADNSAANALLASHDGILRRSIEAVG